MGSMSSLCIIHKACYCFCIEEALLVYSSIYEKQNRDCFWESGVHWTFWHLEVNRDLCKAVISDVNWKMGMHNIHWNLSTGKKIAQKINSRILSLGPDVRTGSNCTGESGESQRKQKIQTSWTNSNYERHSTEVHLVQLSCIQWEISSALSGRNVTANCTKVS